ncbi:MAG: AI-2E family transporter [Candidatus Velthaea sp.]
MMDRRLRYLVTVALVIGTGVLIWMLDLVLGRIRTVTTDIVIAVLVAYLLFPVVRPLARKLPRGIAVLLVYVILIGIIGGGLTIVAPVLAGQAQDLVREFPSTLASAKAQVSGAAVPLPLIGPFEPALRAFIAQYAERIGAFTSTFAASIGTHAVGVLAGSARVVVDTIVVLLLAFFFITDVERIQALTLRVLPAPRRASAQAFIGECDAVIGGFVRGQVLLAIIVGIVVTLILFVLRIKYAALLGLFIGVLSIVPLVGPIVGAIPAILVALFTAGVTKAAIVLVLFVIVFELQSHVLTPIVIGRALGVTPFVIFLAIFVGAEADGVLGMLLAVPLAGIARVAIDRIFPNDATDRVLLASAGEHVDGERVSSGN